MRAFCQNLDSREKRDEREVSNESRPQFAFTLAKRGFRDYGEKREMGDTKS